MFTKNIFRNSKIFAIFNQSTDENQRRSRYLPYFTAWVIAIILAVSPVFSPLTAFADTTNAPITTYNEEEETTVQSESEELTQETTEPPTEPEEPPTEPTEPPTEPEEPPTEPTEPEEPPTEPEEPEPTEPEEPEEPPTEPTEPPTEEVDEPEEPEDSEETEEPEESEEVDEPEEPEESEEVDETDETEEVDETEEIEELEEVDEPLQAPPLDEFEELAEVDANALFELEEMAFDNPAAVVVAEQIFAATGLQVAVSGNVVTVPYQQTQQGYSTIRIDIPAGILVRWAANYRGLTDAGPLFNLFGDGAFEVANDVWISNIGSGNTIISSNVDIIVGSGAVQANSGTAIRVDGETATVTVSGNGSVFTDSNTNLHLAISLTNRLNSGLNVIIRDNGSVAALSYMGNGFAIQTYGDVSVSGNAHIFADTGRAINALGESSSVSVTGGIVWSGTGMAIHTSGANAAVTVTNALVYNEGLDDSHAAIDMSSTGIVTINGTAIVEARDRGTAIKTAGPVYIQDSAEVTATAGRAIHTTGSGSVAITGGFVFAWGSTLANVVDTANFAPPTGDGVVVAWQTTTGQGTYLEMSDLALHSWPDHSTIWHSDGTQAGVLFNDDLFFPIRGVTVNFDESNYGLIFNTTDGSFWLDTDNSGTVTARDIRYRGQANAWRWSTGSRTLSLNDFNWNTTAATALTIVGGDVTINLTDRSTFTATANPNGRGIVANAIVNITGSDELLANGSLAGMLIENLVLSNGIITAIGGENAITANIALPGAYIYWQNETTANPGGTGTEYSTFQQDSPFVNHNSIRYVRLQTNSEGVDLLNVAAEDVSNLANTGTAANPITALVNVPNNMAYLTVADIMYNAANMGLFTDSQFSQEITGLNAITLAEGTATPIYIRLTAADGTTAHYAINIQRAEGTRFNIMFDPTGGEVTPTTMQTEPSRASLAVLPVPTRAGYNFLGWFTQLENGMEITTDTFFTSHIIVYAHWENGEEIPQENENGDVEPEIPEEENGEPETPQEENGETDIPQEENGENDIPQDENGETETPQEENGEVETPQEENGEPETPQGENGGEIPILPQIPQISEEFVIHHTNASIPVEYSHVVATGDTPITFHPGSFHLAAVRANGDTLQHGTDYIALHNQIILLETFFARHDATEFHITFVMDGGTNPHFMVIAPPMPVASEVALLLYNTSAEQWQAEPLLSTTRGTVVTVLYRMAGSPDTTGLQIPFYDVYEGRYYTNAVRWGAFHDIILGYGNENYGPEDNVTREQLAAMLFRYTNFMQLNLGNAAQNVHFTDYGSINPYARPAVELLSQLGIIYGRPDGTFDPQAQVTIGELADLLERFTGRVRE